MEAVRIGEHKLKLYLSAEESEKYGISGSAECKDTAIVRRNVWQALDKAKELCGFDPDGDKLLIQFYKCPDSGCEIFITKLGVLTEASARLVSASSRITIVEKRKTAYSLLSKFTSIIDVLKIANLGKDANNNLQNSGNFQQNQKNTSSKEEVEAPCLIPDIYKSKDGEHYLVFDEFGRESPEPEYLPLLEFATRLPDSAAKYIEEHFERIHIEKDILLNLTEIDA